MLRALCTLAILTVFCLVAETARAEPRRVVLAIANNRGKPQERQLRYAHRDAERFAEAMKEVGGAIERDVHLLLEASREQVLYRIRALAREIAPDSTVVTFYSGHGSEGVLHLGGEELKLSELLRALDALPARLKITFIDACRGAETNKGLEKDQEPFVIQLPSTQHEGQVVVQAAGPGEMAQESDSLKSGIFTHYLVSGMRGAADRNADGRVELQEAYEFAFEKTRWAMLQRGVVVPGGPELDVVLRGQGPLTFTQPRQAHGVLWLPEGPQETFYVVVTKGSGSEVAQAWSRPKRATPLALPSGQFVVHRSSPGATSRAEVALPIGGVRRLESNDFVPYGRQDGDAGAKGEAPSSFSGDSPFPHRVGLAVTLLSDDSEDWAGTPGLMLSYAYGTEGWLPYASASFWHREYAEGTLMSRTGASVIAGLRHQWVTDRATLQVGGGPSATVLRQEIFDRNGGEPKTLHHSLGVGLGLSLGASFPLTSRLSVDWGFEGLATLYRYQRNDAPFGAPPRDVMRYSTLTSLLASLGLTVGL